MSKYCFKLLENARDKKSEPDLIFTLGILAHFALDITFHPIINYLSHNSLDYDRELYLHHHYETLLDSIVNGKVYFYKVINFKALDNLESLNIVSREFNIAREGIFNSCKRNQFFNSLFRNIFLFYLIKVLNRVGLAKIKADGLALCYGNLKREAIKFENPIKYQDIIFGQDVSKSIDDLFSDARNLAKNYINTAISYYEDEITREEAAKVIAGESLATGKVGHTTKDIKFFQEFVKYILGGNESVGGDALKLSHTQG